MEERLSDWLFNFGADNEIVMRAELLEREHDKFQEALNRIAHETHTRTYLVDIAKEALNAMQK